VDYDVTPRVRAQEKRGNSRHERYHLILGSPESKNHLSNKQLPWTPETASALGQIVANIQGNYHGPHNRKRTPQPKNSGKAK